jgi:hypothetical protein
MYFEVRLNRACTAVSLHLHPFHSPGGRPGTKEQQWFIQWDSENKKMTADFLIVLYIARKNAHQLTVCSIAQ